MITTDDMRDEIKDRVLDAIDSGGSSGIDSCRICAEVFDEQDEFDDSSQMSIIDDALDELLDDGEVSFDEDDELWRLVDLVDY